MHLLAESSYRARLVGGPHRCEGRVDVEQNGQWSAVCGYNWDLKNVVVVCRELGCGAAKGTQSSFTYKPQAEENQDFFIEEFHCKGLEDTLAQCEKEDTDYGSCSHQDYAGASCESEYGRARRPSASCPYPTRPHLFVFTSHCGLSHGLQWLIGPLSFTSHT